MDAVADRFIEDATRGLRFLLRALAPTPGDVFLERVMGAHCNGSGHVPGCPNGDLPRFNPCGTVDEAKKKAADALARLRKERKTLTNGKTGQCVKVSKGLKGEIFDTHNIHKTQENLGRDGISPEQAYIIHLEAAANIGELFEKADVCEERKVHNRADNDKKKEAAWHYFSDFTVDGHEKPFTADITVLKFFGADGEEIYAMSLTLESRRNE